MDFIYFQSNFNPNYLSFDWLLIDNHNLILDFVELYPDQIELKNLNFCFNLTIHRFLGIIKFNLFFN